MKRSFLGMFALAALVAGPAWSQQVFTTDWNEGAVASCEATCDAGCDTACNSGCGSSGCCDGMVLELLGGFDAWRNHADAARTGNYGLRVGANAGVPVLKAQNIGVQLGATYGLYDWDGRLDATGLQEASSPQRQLFMTLGLFHNSRPDSPLSWALAYDFNVNDNYGTRSDEPFLGQWRGQVAYALSNANQLGIYGALADRGDTGLAGNPGPSPNGLYDPVSQVDVFWHHRFESGASSRIWIGLPEGNATDRPGSYGEVIIGLGVTAPVSNVIDLYASTQYMKLSASPADNPNFIVGTDREEYYNLSAGIVITPGRNSPQRTVHGRRWQPVLPVADNMSFIVDH